MRRKRHSPEQVVRKLREAEADLASGTALDQVCKRLGVSEATYHRWKKQYGGAGAEEVRRLKAIVADLELDKRILKEALEGNY